MVWGWLPAWPPNRQRLNRWKPAATPAPADPKLRLAPSTDLNEPGKNKVSEEAQKLAKRAIVAMAKGDLKTARQDFLKVLQAVPDNVPNDDQPGPGGVSFEEPRKRRKSGCIRRCAWRRRRASAG
ncbi:Tetratricopeptide TPR_2 repeat protein [Chthoniobacter flavus Ellin428]|uniref:Tetratricopeptide TPR_2 repeat protein n=1 Tax=Chthoniobacter flavus Ellin428 TaxID=497964 RepID=B4D349_9BACT|nr:hypothetical protein [Chthoniobacter flavus]EDY19160.1 Tetratricopeptide TPR_2 repeat protein [Chthoniobacter flavus Ellin428]